MSILFAVAILTATESTWTVDRPLVEIVRAIKQNLDDPSAQLPPDMVRLLSAVDLTATLYARPREHYYRCEFSAGYRKLRIVKTLEVLGPRTADRRAFDREHHAGLALPNCGCGG